MICWFWPTIKQSQYSSCPSEFIVKGRNTPIRLLQVPLDFKLSSDLTNSQQCLALIPSKHCCSIHISLHTIKFTKNYSTILEDILQGNYRVFPHINSQHPWWMCPEAYFTKISCNELWNRPLLTPAIHSQGTSNQEKQQFVSSTVWPLLKGLSEITASIACKPNSKCNMVFRPTA